MKFERSKSITDAKAALPFLNGLDDLYPGFQDWYAEKVVPGIAAGGDILLLAKDAGQVVGIALGKRSEDETKLRCVRVVPAYQQTGIGIRLIDRMLGELECDKPHCTVAEEMLHTYSRAFISRYGFSLNAVDKGRYRPGRLEYSFN